MRLHTGGAGLQKPPQRRRRKVMERADKLVYNVSEAAVVLNVSRPTVYTLIRRADFPAFKVGTRTLISRAGLARWVDAQTTKEE